MEYCPASDAGLLLIKEFAAKIGFSKLIKKIFKTNDNAVRFHKDHENLMQIIYQIISVYFQDDCADELTFDSVFHTVLEKSSLASQPTLSRFFNRMDEDTLKQFDDNEPFSFEQMDKFAEENGLQRISGSHREIYLTNRTKADKLKTILRYKVN